MTKRQIKMLQELLEADGVKGKGYLKQVLWLNTHEPKFKVGDYVLVTERHLSIHGNPVIDFKGQVTRVYHFSMEEDHRYEVTVKVGEKLTTVPVVESQLKKSRVKSMENILSKKSKYEEEISL